MVNGPAQSVTEYAQGANGNAVPVATISGPHTGLNDPQDAALDSAGNLYVTNSGGANSGQSVTEYAARSSGDAVPVATISGDHT
ncbi:MAG TPA: hypothetical protein VGG43_01065 [Acidimicrobiales bacterium]